MIELTTQCPKCQHLFDVNLEQLQQRKGLLRCAQCAHIFDAYACAVAGQDNDSNAPRSSNTPQTDNPSTESLHTISSISTSDSVPDPAIEKITSEPVVISTRARPRAVSKSIINSSQPIQTTAEIESEPYSDIRVYLHTEDAANVNNSIEPVIASLETEPDPDPVYSSNDSEDFIFTPDSNRSSTRSSEFQEYSDEESDFSWASGLWRLLFWLLLLILTAQLLFVYRAHIANTVSFTRPVLQWMCDEIGCDLPYMREIDAIQVSQSALQQQPNFGKEQHYAYQLQLQLKNNLAWAQEWPTLVVSFSDASAAVMATLAISPDQYLSPSQLSRPFEPGAQQSIRVPVTVENKKINGFTVDKYYP